jgi:hypothetical protein
MPEKRGLGTYTMMMRVRHNAVLLLLLLLRQRSAACWDVICKDLDKR